MYAFISKNVKKGEVLYTIRIIMRVEINGIIKEFNSPTRIIDMFDNKNYDYFAAKVNNRLRELNYIVSNDCKIDLLDLTDDSVTKIYQATLRYVIVMAAKNLYPKGRICFNYSVSRSIFASMSNIGHAFLQEDLEKLSIEIHKIISANHPINRYSLTKAEAIEYYRSIGQMDKVKVLKYRPEDTVHCYECNGYKNYMFGYMLPSTGFLKSFSLRLYTPGFLISYPRSECGGKVPEFKDEKVFRTVLKEANLWANTSRAGSISQMNEIIESGNALEFINICEAKHNRQFTELGNKIESNINNIKLICVAGPSSSGKTTFTNRLRIELKSRGIEPVMISMDNFYKSLQETPLDEYGNPDFESIEALDLRLFDKTIFNLIQGEEVKLPIYDFTTKSRSFTEPIKIKPHQPIMVEGIHGLNDLIATSIGEEYKFKIYIAPMAQYNIDDHNPISLSDIRLIRRMVRDHNFRGTGCEKTLKMWSSVRRGEFKWIYPYQNNADYVFNSELSYELCVMKKHAIPLLEAVNTDSPYYIAANRLVKFLKYFEDINDKWIPCNSLLREFIGDSIFYTEDKK